MKIHVRHQWGQWANIGEDLVAALFNRYEYTSSANQYDCSMYITWQDFMGCEAQGAHVRSIPLMTVQHGSHAFSDYLPDISFKPISDHYCAWAENDAHWLRLAGVDESKIHITGSPVINAIHARNREADRKFWCDYAEVDDRPIIVYGPDHAGHGGTGKNDAIMRELVRASQEEMSHCLFIMKIYLEGINNYRGFFCTEGSDDPYDWLEPMNPLNHGMTFLPPWHHTEEGYRNVFSEGGNHMFRGMGDRLPNFIFTCGDRFPQEMLFSAADAVVVPSVATFAVKGMSADIPVIVGGPLTTMEQVNSFVVHGRKPYCLYTDEAIKVDAVEHIEDVSMLPVSILHELQADRHAEGRRVYNRMHGGPKTGAIQNIVNIIERYA